MRISFEQQRMPETERTARQKSQAAESARTEAVPGAVFTEGTGMENMMGNAGEKGKSM